ncbi:MAG: hypothetical protein OSA95_03245 [Opitutales bacterium]|nr:hypothetical protein [Opitutales bacterium]
MFVVKKFVTFFLDPLHMGLTLSLVGLVLLWFFHGRRERQGRLLVTVGVLWICLFGMDADQADLRCRQAFFFKYNSKPANGARAFRSYGDQ